VYRAKVYGVAGFERQFAVKRFHPALVALPAISQGLSQAARAYGSLEHPRIARLHEYGIAAGEVFTATEMVSGLDVMRLVAATHGAGAPLPPGAALALVTQVARAVGYAHGRGVNHLGLCPTNILVTPDGDVKVTDVGVFAQTLTMRPSDDDRLSVRIHYLAPEQMINEPASAASDVFALGALIHELVTGERAFVGVTTLDVEHAILSGHVRDAGLPKPLARVLARCFARSPFERFPDARALADAIDAALRVSPVVGGRRELGQIVKDAVVRLEAMNEGQLSGAMVLAMPMAPSPAQTRGAAQASIGRSSEIVTAIHERPSGLALAPPASAPARRKPQPTQPPPITPPTVVPTVRPVRPPAVIPPIPAIPPPGVATPRIDEDSDERTLQRDPIAPQLSPGLGALPGLPSRLPNASPLPFQTPEPDPEPEVEIEPDGPPMRRSNLRLDSAWPTGDHMAIPDGAAPLDDGIRRSEPLIEMIPSDVIDDDSEGIPVLPEERVEVAAPVAPAAVKVREPVPEPEPEPAPAPKKSSAVWTVLFLMLCAAVGTGAVLAWNRWLRDRPSGTAASTDAEPEIEAPVIATAPKDAATKAVEPKDAATKVVKATAPVDAGVPAVVTDAAPTPPLPAGDGPLVIESQPPGARVFVDGADQGKAPAKVATSGDSHTLAVFLPGYELYTADIGGSGTQVATLTKATPTEGMGGIKILCKEKKRYYVSVDGKGTGQLCPTERIGVTLGTYTVEIYDFVTESRKTFPAKVTGTGASKRIRID
jgi:serine/threonine-protein kinase